MSITPASRCLTDGELQSLYAQSLDAAAAREARAHLAGCSSCWERYSAMDPEATSCDTQTAIPSVMQSSSHFFGRPPQLEGYEIIQELGRGGQAIVYQALQVSTRRKVAIKVAPKRVVDRAPQPPVQSPASPDEGSRFQREIEVLAKLNHPGIVTIHVSGEADGLCYFVMDYISGVPLDEYARRSNLTVKARLQLFVKVCDAVNAAHLLGIVHRDIKPSNVLVDQQDEPRLLDFGLAKLTLGALDPAEMTVTGDFLGTPKWTSPEQAERKPDKVDVRTDVYALGMVLYQLLTADLPYELGGSLSEVEHNIIHAEPERPSRKNRQLDDELDRIVLKCLRKDRSERYQTAGEVARDLRRYLAGEPVEAKSPSLGYLVRTRTRRAVSKAPLVTCVLVVLVSAFVGHAAGYVVQSTRLGGAMERVMLSTAPSTLVDQSIDHVRLISLGDDADIASMAAAEGVEGVLRSDSRSLRRLHGQLMEKLAHSRCRAVVFDIAFPSETPHDEAFVEGVRALKSKGIDVVVGMHKWWQDDGMPDLSPVLAPAVSWGCMAAGLDAQAEWRLGLVARRGITNPRPSLALATLAACRQPGWKYDIELDLHDETCELVYWAPDAAVPNARRWPDRSDRVPLTIMRVARESGGSEFAKFSHFGLGEGDTLGEMLLHIPSDPVLAAATLKYQDVLAADTEQLQKWLSGCAVIVADVRTGADPRRPHPDGRVLQACYAHVVGVENLLRQVYFRRPRIVGEWAIPLAGAAGGSLMALFVRSVWRRRLIGLAAIAAILAIAVILFREFGYLCEPVSPVAGFVAGYVSCGRIGQLRAGRRN